MENSYRFFQNRDCSFFLAIRQKTRANLTACFAIVRCILWVVGAEVTAHTQRRESKTAHLVRCLITPKDMIIFCQNSKVWPNWLGLTGNRATERKEATKSNSGKNSKLTRKCVQEPFSSNLVDWTNKGAVSLTAKYRKEECHSEPVVLCAAN